MEKLIFTAASRRPHSRCHALHEATIRAATMKAAMAMCRRRYGNEGLNTMSHQSTGTILPFSIANPCGVCIQLLEARIQNVEISVPTATISVAR